jgi:hypothetical protein
MNKIMKTIIKIMILILAFYAKNGFGQSTLITPESDKGGIYSKRSQTLNPFVALPSFILPDSGAGTRLMWIQERSAFRAGTVSGNQWNMLNIGAFSFATGFDNLAIGSTSTAFGALNQVSGNQGFVGGLNNILSGNQSFVFGAANLSEGSSSVTLGNSNKISFSGTNTIVIGQNNDAQSTNNFLIGKNNKGKNDLEFAFGFNNDVSAFQAFSIGSLNENAGSQSFNFGESNTTFIERAMNIGFNNNSKGIRALAIGNQNSPKGDKHIALGSGNKGDGVQSISMGTSSKSNSDFSISGGLAIVNNSFGSVMLGIYNDTLSKNLSSKIPSKTEFVAEDPLFVVGNGSKETARSNAITLYKNGKMGLSNIDPTEILDVNGSARFRNVITDNQNTVFLTIESNGTIKKTTLGASDARLKQNVKTLTNPLKKVIQMHGVTYEFKDNPGQKRIGFIAQELEKVMPEVVFDNEEGLKGVRYQEIVALLSEAIKEQNLQIQHLVKKVQKLEKEVHSLSVKGK